MSEREELLQQLYSIKGSLSARDRIYLLREQEQKIRSKLYDSFELNTTADKIQYWVFVIGLAFSVSYMMHFVLGFNVEMLTEGAVCFLIYSVWYLHTKGKRRRFFNLVITLMILFMAYTTVRSIIVTLKDSIPLGLIVLAFTVAGFIFAIPISKKIILRFNKDVASRNAKLLQQLAEINREIGVLQGKSAVNWEWIPPENRNPGDINNFINLVESGKASTIDELLNTFTSEGWYAYDTYDAQRQEEEAARRKKDYDDYRKHMGLD